MYGIVAGLLIALFSTTGSDVTSFFFIHPVPQYMQELPVIPAQKDTFDQQFGWLTDLEIEVNGVSDMCVTDGRTRVYDDFKLVNIIIAFSPCNNPKPFSEMFMGSLDTNITGVYTLSIELVKGETPFHVETYYFYYGLMPRLFVPLMDSK